MNNYSHNQCDACFNEGYRQTYFDVGTMMGRTHENTMDCITSWKNGRWYGKEDRAGDTLLDIVWEWHKDARGGAGR